LAPGRYICIEIGDTGSGIDPQKKARIFDPFFTTKFVGRGLGLAAVAGILRTQRGGIFVDSKPGQGTTFRVFLPASRSAAAGQQSPATQGGLATILVVEDDAPVRNFLASALQKRGYHVLPASDGREAVAACGSVHGAIAAAVVDVIMPDMSATELVATLRARQAGIRILLTSGYTETEARRLCVTYPDAAFIQKPYTAQQLSKAVGELVSGSSPNGTVAARQEVAAPPGPATR
jgi:CheY-like chemotaxis protein